MLHGQSSPLQPHSPFYLAILCKIANNNINILSIHCALLNPLEVLQWKAVNTREFVLVVSYRIRSKTAEIVNLTLNFTGHGFMMRWDINVNFLIVPRLILVKQTDEAALKEGFIFLELLIRLQLENPWVKVKNFEWQFGASIKYDG